MSSSIRVLYLDDDPGLGALMRRALAARGVAIEHVTNPEDAVNLLKEAAFDLVALDHDLGSTTGLEVLSRIKEIESAPPVIYVTGSDDARTAVAALKAGVVDYVWKDIEGHYRELFFESVMAAIAQANLKREKELADRQIREAKERAEAMLSEVNHRVANSLSLVAAMASLQAGASSDEASRQVLKEMQARIHAIAGVHRRLYTSQDVRHVAMDSYLGALAADLSAAINSAHRLIVEVDPGIEVATDKAVSLGVITTELITNALKYAYPVGTAGEIRIHLKRIDADRLSLVVEDDGIGWAGAKEAKGTGIGSRVIRSMATNLQTDVSFDPSHKGTRVVVEFAA